MFYVSTNQAFFISRIMGRCEKLVRASVDVGRELAIVIVGGDYCIACLDSVVRCLVVYYAVSCCLASCESCVAVRLVCSFELQSDFSRRVSDAAINIVRAFFDKCLDAWLRKCAYAIYTSVFRCRCVGDDLLH